MQDLPGTLSVPPLNPARRNFFKGLSKVGLSATAALLFGDLPVLKGQSTSANQDTAIQILEAALIAEDLATTFYYNGLVAPSVIQDPLLAGPGGSATNVTDGGNAPNVAYLRAALSQEIQHADTLRAVGNLGASVASDPYTTFYFPVGTFASLSAFLVTLDGLENAFIGAYLNAVRELSGLAFRSGLQNVPNGAFGGPFSASQLQYFAAVAASIMGVECEHRVLGKVINNTTQPNNLYFESPDTLTSVYHGSKSAVAALTPFLTAATGTGYSLLDAHAGAAAIGLPSTGTVPPQ